MLTTCTCTCIYKQQGGWKRPNANFLEWNVVVCCGTSTITLFVGMSKRNHLRVMHEYAAHVLAWMQAMGSWDMLPQEFFLDLSRNLRPDSDYFEKSSNSIIHVDIILTDGSWFCKLSNYVNLGLYALFYLVMSNFYVHMWTKTLYKFSSFWWENSRAPTFCMKPWFVYSLHVQRDKIF